MTNVKAPCLAAAKALMAPVVSSAVPPVQETQPLIDFLFAGAGVAAGGGLEPAVVPPEPTAPVPVAVGVEPAMAIVTGDPTVLIDPSAVIVVLAAPDLSTVPVTVPVAAPDDDTLPDDVLSVELPCMDPHAASGRANAIETTEKEHAHLTRCLANATA
jgi:hypothetical protein